MKYFYFQFPATFFVVTDDGMPLVTVTQELVGMYRRAEEDDGYGRSDRFSKCRWAGPERQPAPPREWPMMIL